MSQISLNIYPSVALEHMDNMVSGLKMIIDCIVLWPNSLRDSFFKTTM